MKLSSSFKPAGEGFRFEQPRLHSRTGDIGNFVALRGENYNANLRAWRNGIKASAELSVEKISDGRPPDYSESHSKEWISFKIIKKKKTGSRKGAKAQRRKRRPLRY